MTKIRIGVMGCANIAKRSVIPAILELEDLELMAIASRTLEKAEDLARQFACDPVEGYQELIERSDIDAIYMPLPTGLHEEWVDKTLEQGKHILIEKSLAMDHASAQRMVAKAKSKQLLIMENFMFLYHGQHAFVKKLIADGEIGEIRCFRSSFGFPPLAADNFRYSKSLGGGSLLDAAAYTVRASQLFLGEDLKVAAANLQSPGDHEVDIFGGAYLQAAAGTFAEVAFGFDNFYQCNYEIWGSKGKITALKAFTPKPAEEPIIRLEKQGYLEDFSIPAENHFINLLLEFTRCINEGSFSGKYDQILHQSRLLQELRDQA